MNGKLNVFYVLHKRMKMKAMIFAAGLGTRLRPLTDTMPKALVPVGGKPLLQRVVEKLKDAGFDDLVINVHHFADMIEDYVRANGNFGVRVAFSDERDLLRDTGGGILHARNLLLGDKIPDMPDSAMSYGSDFCGKLHDSDSCGNPRDVQHCDNSHEASPCSDFVSASSCAESEATGGFFLVHNVDIISNLDIRWFCSQARPDALAVLLVSERSSSRYLLFDDSMRLVGWTNVRTGEVKSPYRDLDASKCHRYAFSGIHLVSNRIFDAMTDGSVQPLPLSYQPADSTVHPAFHVTETMFPERSAAADSETGMQCPFGDSFSIIDFYLSAAASCSIFGVFASSSFTLTDVGKPETLASFDGKW